MSNLSIVILAAGKGTRMKSDVHKHLNKIAGREMINLVVDHSKNLKAKDLCLVVSDDMKSTQEIVLENCSKAKFVIQKDRNGTGGAVKIALSHLKSIGDTVLILYGDVPLIEQSTLEVLCSKVQNGDNTIAVLGFHTKDIANKYGRLITCGHKIERIVEYKDATDEERAVTLCNSGIMAINGKVLPSLLDKVGNKNASNEYYLTDIIQIARQQNFECTFIECTEDEAHGVNSKIDLSEAEAIMQNRLRKQHMINGVTLIDPQTTYFSLDTEIGRNVTISPNVVFGKGVIIKNNITIKPFTYLEDTTIL
jgi:bifunctional UDP-N-acetylglucosamine pyrophosphorylase/glucosamine-1-phosphate N-acetyltransferase